MKSSRTLVSNSIEHRSKERLVSPLAPGASGDCDRVWSEPEQPPGGGAGEGALLQGDDPGQVPARALRLRLQQAAQEVQAALHLRLRHAAGQQSPQQTVSSRI